MNEAVIRAENLGKLYQIGEKAPYETLREAITNIFAAPLERLKNGLKSKKQSPNCIWALKNVSFEIKKGEAVGIIGLNGAGKSTLLKILSRITPPTEGYAEVHGRIGSLLEVGTGFHPELTGRDNIYLNGVILGMKKAEIERKFDDIVAFSELGKFIDTPVKHYSSGMYVRLAFAVAAHLEMEILLVDEILAVGDVTFQKRCLGKMGVVAKEGRTILFVSHNMAAVGRLCQRTIWLKEGCIQMFGDTDKVIAAYISAGAKEKGEIYWHGPRNIPGDENIRLRAARIRKSDGQVSSALDIRQPFFIEIEYEVLRTLSNMRVGFRIVTSDGVVVFTSADSINSAWQNRPREPGIYLSRCEIPGNFLNEGQYALLNIWADIPFIKTMFFEENVLTFHIEQTGGVSGQFPERWSGVICPELNWTITVI